MTNIIDMQTYRVKKRIEAQAKDPLSSYSNAWLRMTYPQTMVIPKRTISSADLEKQRTPPGWPWPVDDLQWVVPNEPTKIELLSPISDVVLPTVRVDYNKGDPDQ